MKISNLRLVSLENVRFNETVLLKNDFQVKIRNYKEFKEEDVELFV